MSSGKGSAWSATPVQMLPSGIPPAPPASPSAGASSEIDASSLPPVPPPGLSSSVSPPDAHDAASPQPNRARNIAVFVTQTSGRGRNRHLTLVGWAQPLEKIQPE